MLTSIPPNFLLGVTLFLSCGGGGYGQGGAPATVDVGGARIVIPSPADFFRSDGVSAKWDQINSAMLPATNRLLIKFSSKDDVEALGKGGTPLEHRGFNAQVVRSVESREIGEKTFAQVRDEARAGIEKMKANLDAEIKKLAASGSKELSGHFGADVALTVSDTAVLGFFDESPSSLGFTMAMKLGAGVGKGTAASKIVTAGIMCPVNGRLLNFYATSTYENEGDRQWAEKAVTAWRDSVRAANPRVEGPSARGGFLEGVGRSTVTGGVIGALVGLAVWFMRRRSA